MMMMMMMIKIRHFEELLHPLLFFAALYLLPLGYIPFTLCMKFEASFEVSRNLDNGNEP